MTFKKYLASALVLGALFTSGAGFASANSLTSEVSESESLNVLQSKVAEDVEDNIYRTPNGDGIKGGDLLNDEAVVSDRFDELSEKEKNRFLTDVDRSAQEQVAKDKEAIDSGDTKTNVVTAGTVNSFWNKLKDKSSVASRMIVVATQGFQADFQGAAIILAPFTPFVNTGTAVLILLASMALFFFIAVDIFFFTATPFQYMVINQKDKGVGKFGSMFVSERAKKSVEDANKDGKNPIISYFFKSWLLLIAYAVVLLYFASNSMLTLAGPAANLISGLLGF